MRESCRRQDTCKDQSMSKMEGHTSITVGEIVQTLQMFSTNKPTTLSKQLVSFLGLLCMYSSNGNEFILANGRIRTNLLSLAKSLIVVLESTTDHLDAVAYCLQLTFYLLIEGFVVSRTMGHRTANESDLLAETLSLLKKNELFNAIVQWRALGRLATLQDNDEHLKKTLSFMVKRVNETAEVFGRRGGGSSSLLVSGMGIDDSNTTNDTNTTLVAAKLQSLRQMFQDSRIRENLPLQCLDAIFVAAGSPSCIVARRACSLILDYAQSAQEEVLIAVVIHLASDSVTAAAAGKTALISSDARCCSYLLRTIQTILSTSSLPSSSAGALGGDDGINDDRSSILSDDAAVDLYRSTLSFLKHPRYILYRIKYQLYRILLHT